MTVYYYSVEPPVEDPLRQGHSILCFIKDTTLSEVQKNTFPSIVSMHCEYLTEDNLPYKRHNS